MDAFASIQHVVHSISDLMEGHIDKQQFEAAGSNYQPLVKLCGKECKPVTSL